MAEQPASAVASAVIGGITNRAHTTMMRKLRSRSRPAAAHQKLERLEMLVLKLRSVIQVSERHAIRSASLLEWRDRLREAAAEGGAVVLNFQRRAREEEDGDAAATSADAPGQQRPAGVESGSGATAGALYFTRGALSGMAQRVREATTRLFSADEDAQKLDSALEKMQRLSPDINQFLMALQLEASPELGQVHGKRRWMAPRGAGRRARTAPRGGYQRVTESAIVQLASAAETLEHREREARMLARVLEATLQRTESNCIKKADDRDIEGLESLAEWAAVYREAVERGKAVLETLRLGSDVIHKDGGALEEDGELYRFVRLVQRLWVARYEPSFTDLVNLCPRKQ